LDAERKAIGTVYLAEVEVVVLEVRLHEHEPLEPLDFGPNPKISY
jgi:hypothetical protein